MPSAAGNYHHGKGVTVSSLIRMQVLNITESEAIVKLSDGEMKVLDKGIIGLLHGATA